MRLKHFLSVFLTLLTFAVGQMWATDPSVSVISGSFATSGTIGSIFPYTIVQNSGSNAPYTTSGNLRMYYQTNGNGQGNKFTISVPDGYTITGVTITASSGYTPTVKYNIDGGSDVTGTWSSTTMTISSISATSSFAFRNANTSSTQLRPTNVTVYYTTATPAKAYKVSFSTGEGNSPVAARTESSVGAGITLPSTSDLTPACSSDGWVLYGWTTAAYGSSSTTTAPTTTLAGLAGATYYPTDDITLHAVYKRAEGLAGTTMWSENFTGLSADAQPTSPSANGSQVYNSASVTYTCQTSYTKIYTNANAGGTSPEILVPQSSRNGYFRATGIPTGGETSFTLTYKTNQSGLVVATTTSGVTISAATGSNPYTRTITTNSSSISSFILTFSMSTSSNARLDDISVVANGTCYYWSAPTCCTKLGQINGSFNCTNNSASARVFSWANETTASDVDHYELSYKQKNVEGNPTSIANDISNSTHAYTHTANLTEGITYTYYLKAVGANGHCDATEVLDVLIPYATSTVTFNDNDATSGSVPTSITQNTGTTVTVPGNTGNLAKDNYAFGGWNTKDDGTGTNYVADATFTLSNDITLYAKWDCAKKVTLTKGTPSNGSFSLSEADGDKYTCDAAVVVTVSDITPNSGYRFGAITQTGLASGVTIDQANKTVTYAQYASGASTINVEFEQIPVHTITWSVNGETSTTNVTDGDALVLESNPTSCDPTNYGTFVGWYTTAAGSDSNPSDAVSGTKATASHKPAGDETYYAVWANGAAEGDFALVTDASELNVGDVVTIIASVTGNEESGKVIKAYNSGSNWPSTDVTTSATGKIAASTTDMQTFTLAEGTVDDTWAFNDGTGYIYAANTSSGNSNHMKREAELDAKGSFAIEIDGAGAASVVSQGDVNGKNTMRFNGSNNPPIFSCYASGSQNDIYLYKQESGATAFISTCCTKHNITLDNEIANGSVAATETSACEGTSVRLTATPTPNAGRFKTWDVTGMTLTNEQKATNPLDISMPNNDVTVSATFNALYAITKSETGGTITLGANYAAENDVVTISAVAKQDYEEPRELKVYKTNDESTEITITNGQFTMPGYPVTAKVTYTASKTPLDPPTMSDNSNLTYNSIQLNWTNVANNSGYALTVKQGDDIVEGYDAKAIDQDATSAVISGLEHLTAYTYTLYAKGDGVTYVAVNTAANGGFTTLDYPTVKIYYSENEVLRVAEGTNQKILTDFTLPNNALTGCTQKELVGWTTAENAEYSHDTDAPEGMLLPGAKWQIPTNANCTLYAVYAKNNPETVSWSRVTAISTLTDGGTFIVGYEDEAKSGEIIPLRSADCNATTSANGYFNTGTSNTSSGSGAIDMSSVSSTSDYEVYISSPTDGKINIQMGTSTGNYYGATSGGTTSNKGRLYTSGNSTETNIIPEFSNEGNNHFKLKTAVSGDYKYLKYNTGSPRFAFYNSAGEKVVFYKKNVTPATTTNYATQCMAQVAKPSISGVTDSETYEENKTVTITCETSDATIYYSIDGQNPATEYTEPFTLSDNGEYTIRAYATKSGMIDSEEATSVTVTIDKPFTTIADFIEHGSTTEAKKLVLTGAVVLGKTGKNIFVQDATGGIILYNSNADNVPNWASGKAISGYVMGVKGTYQDMPEVSACDFSNAAADNTGTLPTPVAINEAFDATNYAANVCKLVTASGLQFQAQSVADNGNIDIKRGDDTYKIWNAFNALTEHNLPVSSTACAVTGILGKNNSGAYQLMPIDANCITTGANASLPSLTGEEGGVDTEHAKEVPSGEKITFTAVEGFTTQYQIGEGAKYDVSTSGTDINLTGNTDDIIAITITSAREYYNGNVKVYYYKINNALIKYDIESETPSNGSFVVKNSGGSAITSSMAAQTITLAATADPNYHFLSWAIKNTETTADVTSAVELSSSSDKDATFVMPAYGVTVSASFEEDDYATINFVKGAESATGSAPASIAKAYVGKEVTLPINTFALAENDFAGWKHGENTYAEGAKYTVTAADYEASTITFTAQWTPWPIWATTYTSNIIKSGINTPDSKVIPEDTEEYDAWKIAKGSSITLTIPAGTTTIYGHLVAWKSESAAVTISGSCFSENRVITPAADDGISNNSPFTLVANGSTFYFKLTPDVAITEDVNITFQTSGTGNNAKRAVVFGVNAVFPEITLDPASYNFGNVRANQTKSQEFAITANENVSGTLSATLLNNESGKFSVSDIEDNKVTVTFDPDGATSGDFSAQLKISASNAEVTADLTGTAIAAEAPEIVVDKNTVAFGQVDPNAEVSEAIAVELLHIDGAVSAALGGDDAAKFGLSADELTADGELVITPNTTENGIFSATLTLSATGAEAVVIPMSITVANKWAVMYTSNVTNLSSDENKKVKVGTDNTEYNLVKANKGSSATFKVPRGTQKIHVHMVAWSGEGQNVTISGPGCFTSSKVETITDNENLSGTSWSPLELEEAEAISYYYELTPDVIPSTETTITITAASGKRFAIFGVNQEGGIIEISEDTNASAIEDNANIEVKDGATLTVDADKTLNNLTVEAGGKVSGSANLTVNNFTIEGTHGTSGQVMNAENLHINGEAYFDFTLGVDVSTPEGAAKAEAQWHNFSVPFPVNALTGVFDAANDAEHLTNEVDYAIEDYHGELRKNGEYGWKKFRGTMTPGHTYSMTVNGDIQTYRFKKSGDYSFVANPTVGFSEHAATGSETSSDAGWNGLGNMRLCYSSISNDKIAETTPQGQSAGRYVLVLDAESYNYVAYLLTNINLTVGSAFFIQASADGELGFNEAQDGAGKIYAPARTKGMITEPIMVTMSGERGTDHMYISADEDATNTYQIGRDMQRMFATSNPTTPLIYTMNYGGLKLAAEDAPMVNGQAVYTLQLYAPIAGEHTLKADAVADADVYLTYEGAIIWNISESEYTVDLNKGKNDGYGLKLVKKAPAVVTGVDQIDAKSDVQKVILDEKVFILRGSKMYDVTGKAVK